MNDLQSIDIKVFDSVPDQYVTQIDSLLEEVQSNHRISDSKSLSENSQEMYDSKKDVFKYIIALDRDIVVGLIILFKREITFKGKKLLLGGFGGVGTKTEYRNRGIGSKMVELARKMLEESRCDVAHIDVDMDNPSVLRLYGRIGFIPLRRPFTFLGKSGRKYSADNSMLAPIHSKELFEAILNDHNPFDIYGGNW